MPVYKKIDDWVKTNAYTQYSEYGPFAVIDDFFQKREIG